MGQTTIFQKLIQSPITMNWLSLFENYHYFFAGLKPPHNMFICQPCQHYCFSSIFDISKINAQNLSALFNREIRFQLCKTIRRVRSSSYADGSISEIFGFTGALTVSVHAISAIRDP